MPWGFQDAPFYLLVLGFDKLPLWGIKSQVGPQNQVANNRIEGNLGEEWCEREAVEEKEEGEDGLQL